MNTSEENLWRTLRRGIKAFSRIKDLNPDSPENDELVDYLVGELFHLVRPPVLREICLVVDDDGKGGYVNPRIVEWTGSAEEVLYPEDPETGEPVDERIADYMIPLPDPQFLPEV
jgi:hypothetical protein